MTNKEIAYAEVDAILDLMDEKYLNKIPNKLRNIIKKEKDLKYKVNIDIKKSLYEQKLQRGTMIILATLCFNYWCDSEDEKQELLRAYSENDKKQENEAFEKYNPDNIFKEKENRGNCTDLIEYSESTLSKLWKRIKSFFARR